MKFLIYAVGLIIESLIITLLGYTDFFQAPWVKAFWTTVLFAVYIILARYLCKKWDQHVLKKVTKTEPSNDDVPEEEQKSKAQQAKKKYRITRVIALIISIIVLFSVFLVTGEIFTTTKEVVTYEEHTEIEKVETYVCYISATGICYHSRYCQYITSDNIESYKSNVYEAKAEGYKPCSKCTPRTKTTIAIEKTVSEPKTETKTVPDYIAANCFALGVAVILYCVIVFKARRNYKNIIKGGI